MGYKQAFSLIELLLVLAVFSVMFLLVAPFSEEVASKNRVRAIADEFIAALRFTRVLAIKLGEPVMFCGSSDQKSCNGRWQEGGIIVTSSGQVERVLSKISAKDRLIWQGSFGKKDGIVFLPTGFASGYQGSFYYCSGNNPENFLAVILEATGRVRVANKTAAGKTISCNF